MKAQITVTLKPGLLDAQGKTIKSALESLGFKGVLSVRVGKYLELELNQRSAASAKREVERMCQKLLANTIIEHCQIRFAPGHEATTRPPRRARAASRKGRKRR